MNERDVFWSLALSILEGDARIDNATVEATSGRSDFDPIDPLFDRRNGFLSRSLRDVSVRAEIDIETTSRRVMPALEALQRIGRILGQDPVPSPPPLSPPTSATPAEIPGPTDDIAIRFSMMELD